MSALSKLTKSILPLSGGHSLIRFAIIFSAVLILASSTSDRAGLSGRHHSINEKSPQSVSQTEPDRVQLSVEKDGIRERLALLPLQFEMNQGQRDEAVKFISRGTGFELFLTADSAVLKMQRSIAQVSSLGLKFDGANPTAKIEAIDEMPGRSHYFIGSDPMKWRTGIPNYGKVRYSRIYPGIDLVYYGKGRQLEYDFVVSAGADPNRIRISYTGQSRIRADKGGNLVLSLPGGEILQHKPVIFQTEGGKKKEIQGRYVVAGENTVAFQIDSYDRTRDLIIDPVISFSTYLGGGLADEGNDIAVDASGNIYLTGRTFSTDLKTTDSSTLSGSLSDIFVTKIGKNTSGDQIINFSAYIGGADDDTGKSIAVDSAGNIYVSGTTASTKLPIVKGYQKSLASGAFLKSSQKGDQWAFSSAGLSTNTILDIAVESGNAKNIYVATAPGGIFRSADGGLTWNPANGDRANNNARLLFSNDVRRIVFNSAGSSILYAATSAGIFKSDDKGANWDQINGKTGRLGNTNTRDIAIDSNDTNIIYTATPGGVYKSVNGGMDWASASGTLGDKNVVTLALSQANPAVLYAGTESGGVFRSRDGGANWAQINNKLTNLRIRAIAIDPKDSKIVYAGTQGGIFRSVDEGGTWASISNDIGNTSIRALAIDARDTKIIYAVTAGGVFRSDDTGTKWVPRNSGQTNDDLRTIAMDPSDSATLYLGAVGANDSFLVKLSPAGLIVYSTYLGGGSSDLANGLEVDSNGNAFIAGTTFSTNLPVKSALKNSLAGLSDAFVAKIDTTKENDASLIYSTYIGGQGSDQAEDVALDANGSAYIVGTTSSVDFPATTDSLQPAYGNYSIFATSNSADSWKPAGRGITGDTVNALASGNKILIAGNLQGLYTSADGGTTWITRRSDVDVRSIVVDPKKQDVIYAGTAVGVLKSVDNGVTWTSSGSFSVRSLAIDGSTDPATVLAGTSKDGLYKSSDSGASWSVINGPVVADRDCPDCLPGARLDAAFTSTNVQSIVVDPSNSKTVYVSVVARGVYKTIDGGSKWAPANSGLPAANGVIQVSVSSLVINPSTPATLYAGTDKGIYKSTDAGVNWVKLAATEINDNIRALVIDSKEPMTLYAITSKGILRSSDDGATWALKNTGLNSSVINALAIDTADNKKVYAGSGGGQGDAFVAKLKPEGNGLLYSTLLGGGDSDSANAIALSATDIVNVTGSTFSTNFPTTDKAYSKASRGISDAFITRLDLSKTGSAALTYSSYLGGNGSDRGNSITLGPDNRVYITGATSSLDFPLSQGIVNIFGGGSDAFIASMKVEGAEAGSLVFSTYLGGSGNDSGNGIAFDRTDAAGAIWITGTTSSSNLVVTDKALDKTCGTDGACNKTTDAFLIKVSNGGGSADLAISLSHSGLFRIGQSGSITITVTNNGPDAASAPITVVDTLPAGLSYATGTGTGWSCLAVNNIVSCTGKDALPSGTSSQVVITVNVGVSAQSTLTNAATVSSTTSDPLTTGKGSNSAVDTITVDRTPCTFTLSQLSGVFPSSGGSTTVVVTTQESCDWNAVSNDAFIRIDSKDKQKVTFSVLKNPDTLERKGTLTIAGQTYSVTQSPDCGYAVSPASASIPSTGGVGAINITAVGTCSWTARLNDSTGFIRLTSATSGLGNGVVTFSAPQNQTTSNRTATIDILAGTTLIQTVTIDQAESGCSYSISPMQASFLGNGGDGTVKVTSGKDTCDWSVLSNNTDFITVISGSRQIGNNIFVAYRVTPNPISSPRTGTISIAGIPFTVNQSGGVTGSGGGSLSCTYDLAILPGQQAWNAGGGSGSVSLTTQNGCSWQASSSANFLSVNGNSSGSGSRTFNFTIAQNAGPSARSAYLTIAGLTVVFFQDAPKAAMSCETTVIPAVTTFNASGGDSFILITSAMDVCQWTAQTDKSFVKLRNDNQQFVAASFNPLIQTGTAYVVFAVEANTSPESRSAILTVAGKAVTITQSGKPAQGNQNNNAPLRSPEKSAILPRRTKISRQ
jgi:uncharacterized repeat protein (TIGR01451 family)